MGIIIASTEESYATFGMSRQAYGSGSIGSLDCGFSLKIEPDDAVYRCIVDLASRDFPRGSLFICQLEN